MKTKIFLSLFAAAMILCAQPKLFVEERTFDFGTVPEGDTKLLHKFTIVNKGNEALKITSVRPSCGCTVAEFDTLIEPGKTGSIAAEFNTSGFTGNQEKILNVFSNDPDSSRIQLKLTGYIKTALELSQRWMNLNSNNGKVKGSVSFLSLQSDFSIKKAQFSLNNNVQNIAPAKVNTTLKNKSKPDKNGVITYDFDFEFNFDANKKENGKIKFETNIKQKPSIELNVGIEPKEDVLY